MVPTKVLYISPVKKSPGQHRSNSSSKAGPHRGSSHDEKASSLSRKKTRVVQGHLMPIRDLDCGYDKEHYLEDPEDVLEREFGEP